MSRHSWSKFWWADYERDPALKLCSLAAQGAWMRLLCHMHEGEPPGHLTVNGKPPTMRQISLLIGATETEAATLVQELSDMGVVSETKAGVLYSRRMKRDDEYRRVQSKHGKNGGNPTLLKRPLRGVVKVLEAEAESESERERGAPAAPAASKGTRLPDDWQPSAAEEKYAADLGLAPNITADKFRDHWHAAAGPKALRCNWSAMWRNWCRREAGFLGLRPPALRDHNSPPPPPPRFL